MKQSANQLINEVRRKDGRSTKKGPYIDEKLQKKMLKLNQSGEKKVVKTWARASMITRIL